MECFTGVWKSYFPLALFLLFFFAIGVPFVLTGFMIYHRHNLKSPAIRQRVGFLMARYRSGVQWWEVFEVTRKMTLTGLLIYFPGAIRSAIAVLICIVSVILLNYFRPHLSKPIFWICQGAYFITTVKYLVTTFKLTKEDGMVDWSADTALGLFLIVLDISLYILGVV